MTTGIARLQRENKVLTRNTCIAEPRETITTSKITTQTLGFLRRGILDPMALWEIPDSVYEVVRVVCLSRSWFICAPPATSWSICAPPPPGAYNERTLKAMQKRNLFSQGNLVWYPTNAFQFIFSLSWASSQTWMYGWLSSIGLGNIQRDQLTPSVGAQ